MEQGEQGQRIESLLSALEDKSDKTRISAVEDLIALFPKLETSEAREKVGKALIATTGDKKWPVRDAATAVFPLVNESWAGEPLVEAFQKHHINSITGKGGFDQLADALIRVSSPTIFERMVKVFLLEEPFEGMLNSADWENSQRDAGWKYIDSAGETAIEYIVANLFLRVRKKKFSGGAWYRIMKFGEIAVEPLVNAIRKENMPSPTRLFFNPQINWIRWGLGSFKDDDSYKEELSKRQAKYSPSLIEESPSPSSDYQYLDKAGIHPALSALTFIIMDDTKNCQEALVNALKLIGEPAVNMIALDLNGESGTVAAMLLGDIAHPAGTEPLIAVVDDKRANSGKKLEAIKALGKIGGSSASEKLMAILKDKNPEIRQQAAEALGVLKDHQATEALLSALGDEKPGVRKAAAKALGMLGDKTAVPGLIEHLTDNGGKILGMGEGVGDVVVQALELIGTPEALNALSQIKKG